MDRLFLSTYFHPVCTVRDFKALGTQSFPFVQGSDLSIRKLGSMAVLCRQCITPTNAIGISSMDLVDQGTSKHRGWYGRNDL